MTERKLWDEKDLYTCRMCHEVKNRLAMKDVAQYNGKGRCRKCMNEQHRFKAQLRNAARTPHSYRSCDDCDAIYHEFGQGRKILKDRVVKISCPKCKSTNTAKFI